MVTVAELLARNGGVTGTTGRAHRRRARDGGISVAELTGEIPIIRDPAPTEAAEPAAADVPEADVLEAAETEAAVPEAAVPEAGASEEPAAEAVDSESTDSESAEAAAAETESSEAAAAETKAEEAAETDEAEAGTEAEAEEATESDADAESDAAAEAAGKIEPATAEQTRAYSEYDAVADAGPQSPREFASTASMPVLTPLASSVRSADEDADAELAVGEQPEQAEAEPADSAQADGEGADAAEAPVSNKGALRQWAVLALQAVVGVVVGAALFIGFERLWDNLPYVALVLAILVIVAMVAVVRILRRTDDIVSVLIAVVVGVIVTIGPLAFVLSTS